MAAAQDKGDDVLQTFMEITQLDEVESYNILNDTNWKLETAIQHFFALQHAQHGLDEGSPVSKPDESSLRRRATANKDPTKSTVESTPHASTSAPPESNTRPANSTSTNASEPRQFWSLLLQFIMAPIGLCTRFFGGLFRFIFTFVSSLIPGFLTPTAPTTPLQMEQQRNDFARLCGSHPPTVTGGSLLEASRRAHRDLKFLLVYLHDPNHRDTARFCQETLGAPNVVSFVNDNLLFWTVSVDSLEGRNAARSLQAGRYPFTALLVTAAQQQLRAVFRTDVFLPATAFLEVISRHMELHQGDLIVQSEDRASAVLAQRIRVEQDAAYQETLMVDQAKEKLKQEAAMQEARLKEEAINIEREAEKQKLVRLSSLETKRRNIPPLPTASEPSTRIALKFSNGKRSEREFSPSLSLQSLYDFVDTLEIVAEDFTLITSHPAKALPRSDATLADLGLVPRALILVQDNTV